MLIVLDKSYGPVFLFVISVANSRSSVKIWLWGDIQFLKNIFCVGHGELFDLEDNIIG